MGGFLMFICSKNNQYKIIKKLKKLKKIDVKFDYSGTRITYIDRTGESK